jgi:hypothetical protein
MGQRLELQQIFLDLLGSPNVYFQPPPTFKMIYPCIMYRRDFNQIEYADDKPYAHKIRYLVTVIDRDPDSDIPDKIALLPFCVYDRFYTADNLNHDVFKLFF